MGTCLRNLFSPSSYLAHVGRPAISFQFGKHFQAYLPLLMCCAHRGEVAILEPDTHCVTFSAHACMLSRFSRGQLFVPLWTVDDQALLSTGFSRQEYWSRLPCLPPGIFPHPGIQPISPVAHVSQASSLPLIHWRSLNIFSSLYSVRVISQHICLLGSNSPQESSC